VSEAVTITSNGLRLAGYLARPTASAAKGTGRYGLVVCHGFPAEPRGAKLTGHTYPQLAERIAGDAGWVVLTFNLRGTGDSQGDFSLGGWLTDLKAAVSHLQAVGGVQAVWLCGFSIGASLSICAAGEDPQVRGVAAFSAPADFSEWAVDPRRLLERARAVGVVRQAGFPADFDAWARELREIRPLSLVAKIPPRSLLLVHGADDDVVPMLDARALAEAADGGVELRILAAAGHRLRHDPRAVALLLGWLERQLP
jgi:putative redox protein